MPNLFASLPIRNRDLLPDSLQTLVNVHEREMFTGILHLQTPTEGEAALYFVQGKMVLLHALTGAGWLPIPPTDWRMRLSHLGGDLRVLTLPVEGLRTVRLFLDTSGGEENALGELPARLLSEKIGEWQASASASLIYIEREDTLVFVALPGNLLGATEALLLAPEHFQTGAGVLNQFRAWGERPCRVTHHTNDIASASGREYALRLAFLRLVQKALERYQDLAGRFLVGALGEEINHLNRSRGWSLYFAGAGVTHREFFQDAGRAGAAYQVLLANLENEMQLVVGSQVANQIIGEALSALSPRAWELVNEYIVSKTSLRINQMAEAS